MAEKETITYKILAFFGVHFIALIEWIIRSNSERSIFFQLEKFPWVQKIEPAYTDIKAELENLFQIKEEIPDFSYLSTEQQRLVQPLKWKSFIFCAYGAYSENNCKKCPKTFESLKKIKHIKTAMFSVFEPNTHILPHRGVYCGLLRYHLALIVPKEKGKCAINILGEVRHWEEGKSLIFDDTFEHEAWNKSDEVRVVLFVDFEKPLPFWLIPLNRFMIWLIKVSPLVQNIMGKIK